MGTVYRAHDGRLARDVAIKLLRPDTLADRGARHRFRHEALALSRLNHPNIAGIFDFDTQDAIDFIVMELVPGETLSARLTTGPLPEAEVVRLGAQLADGLEAAHQAGVVHRDLKPGNLRVTPEGRLKILDFGIAKDVGPAAGEAETRSATVQGAALGTPAYMAPEQLRGEPADTRADIYASGAVLYEMATGRPPHCEPNVPLLIDAVLHEAPVSPRALNARVTPGLEAIVLKALDKDPQQRYQSAKELLVDLRRLAAPQPSTTRTSRVATLFPRKPRTRRWALGLSATAIVAAVALTVWMAGSRTALSFAPRDWILLADLQNDTGNSLFDRSLATALRVSLEQSVHANVLPPARVAAALRRMGRTKVERMDEELGREICLRENTRGLVAASLSRVGPQYLLSAQLIDPTTGERVRTYTRRVENEAGLLDAVDGIARDLRHDLGESLAAIEQSSRPLPLVTTSSLQALRLYCEGVDFWSKGDYHTAVRQHEAALADDPDFAMAHAALGNAYMSFIYNDRVKGRRHLERALELAHRTTERERLVIQIGHAEELATPAQAERLFRLYLSQYPDDASMRYNFGSKLMRLERHREAVEQLAEVVRVAPTSAGAYINLASSLSSLNEYSAALAAYDKAFALEPAWKLSGNLNHEYGFALVETGDREKAREVFGLALARPADRARALRSLALLDVYEGRHQRAIERFGEAALTNEAGKFGLSAARDRLFLATTLDAVGSRARAMREMEAANRLLGADVQPIWMPARLGQAFARAGALRRAEELLASARPHVEPNNAEQQAEVLGLEAEIEMARGRTTRAVELLDRAYRQRPWPLTLVGLARGEIADGRLDKGLEHYREVLRLSHRFLGWEAQAPLLSAHHELARLLEAKGERDEARKVIDRLLDLWKDGDGTATLHAEARALRARLDAANR
jgi:serine/threonine protein kinase/tetratricopeptide (TPR) repeat protein